MFKRTLYCSYNIGDGSNNKILYDDNISAPIPGGVKLALLKLTIPIEEIDKKLVPVFFDVRTLKNENKDFRTFLGELGLGSIKSAFFHFTKAGVKVEIGMKANYGGDLDVILPLLQEFATNQSTLAQTEEYLTNSILYKQRNDSTPTTHYGRYCRRQTTRHEADRSGI